MPIFYDDVTKTWFDRNLDHLPTMKTPKTEEVLTKIEDVPKKTEDVQKKAEDLTKKTEDFKNARGVKRQRINDSDKEYSVRSAQVYQGHDMIFLKGCKTYTFEEPVMLTETKYNYRLSKIADVDVEGLNLILEKLNPKLKLTGNDAFMNAREIRFKNNAFPGEWIDFNDALRWKLVIQVQGYKISVGGKTSPIWKILEGHQSI